MTLDASAVDEALTTTRAVRLRLDLEREVDDQIILDAIDVAEQAPTGGNQGSRRWIVVRDPELKSRLAELYMEAAGQWMVDSYERIKGTGHHNERVMKSASYLAEHLAEVPAIVVPTILGVHDNSGRPGLFDSVIQAAWSFCVALRARGLGTAWTTAILSKDDDLAELLDIPEGVTQIAMLPVAWTKGTDFQPAPRYPARAITYFDGYARTWASGPSSPPTLADGPGTIVEVDIDAPPEAVWALVSDIDLPARFSEEFLGAKWADGVDGPSVGAEFIGRNTHEAIGEWEVSCFLVSYEPLKAFGWNSSDPETPGAQWRFQLEAIAGATRLRFGMTMGPGPSGISQAIAAMPDKEPRILRRRVNEHRTNMTRVVDGVKELAEAAR